MTTARYPLALYLRGWDDLAACVTVADEAAEAQARAAGYRGLDDPTPVASDLPAEAKRPRGRPRKEAAS